MRKSEKHKKSKVPKLTEAEYAAYISSLKSSEEEPLEAPVSATNEKKRSVDSLRLE